MNVASATVELPIYIHRQVLNNSCKYVLWIYFRMNARKVRSLQYKRKWSSVSRSLNKRRKKQYIADVISVSTDESDHCSDAHDTDENYDEVDDLDNFYSVDDSELDIHCTPEKEDNSLQGQGSSDTHSDMIWNVIDHLQDMTILSDSEDDSENDEVSLTDDLVGWVNEFCVKHNAVDSLLKILRKHGHAELPCVARTLMKTVRDVQISTRSSMEYYHIGLKTELMKKFQEYPDKIRTEADNIDISLNIDGIPLFKSTKKSLWPILCAIHLEPQKVFPVTLCLGESKPSNLDFLKDTIQELDNILEHGMECDGKLICVKLRAVICDAPAKAMVKAIKQYSGYHGCDMCTQPGIWKGRICYPETNAEIRTDEAFRQQAIEEHHNGISPFCEIPVDMIRQFPLDYMHQACLGVMKRLMLTWMRGNKEVKISAGQIKEISKKLTDLRRFVPREFARKPRPLDEVDQWKATEYRQLLLYTGKLVLRGILKDELYNHFLTFSVAMSILVCPRLAKHYTEYAHNLLVYFVEKARELYGIEFLVYNVHAMTHIAANVEEHGCLDNISAFPFENYLQHVKRMVRSGNNPLAQIIKRTSELQYKQNTDSGVYAGNNSKLSTRAPNAAYILHDNSCCEIVEVTNKKNEHGRHILLCRVYTGLESLFVHPCNSTLIGVYKGDIRKTAMKLIPDSYLDRKAMMIVEEHLVVLFLAILHAF